MIDFVLNGFVFDYLYGWEWKWLKPKPQSWYRVELHKVIDLSMFDFFYCRYENHVCYQLLKNHTCSYVRFRLRSIQKYVYIVETWDLFHVQTEQSSFLWHCSWRVFKFTAVTNENMKSQNVQNNVYILLAVLNHIDNIQCFVYISNIFYSFETFDI